VYIVLVIEYLLGFFIFWASEVARVIELIVKALLGSRFSNQGKLLAVGGCSTFFLFNDLGKALCNELDCIVGDNLVDECLGYPF
jgi:hypothetical protein